MTHVLPSTKALADKYIKQWGVDAFVRYCHNIGIPFDDCYIMVFGVLPRGEA